ncbi:MAG: transcriptional regulator MraZ [Chloroflexota bacterium]|nr:transcriptional regulator MraZ [Chloroflexota bacterium]
MFTGEYRHSVDDKGRIAVPAKFRPQLDGGAYLARWVDACLAIFPKTEFEDLAAKVGGLGIADASARTFSRALFASAYEVELDRQGRIVIPASLRDLLGLAGDAVVVGARDHVEIWAPSAWDDYRKAMEAPDALAAHLTGLGI